MIKIVLKRFLHFQENFVGVYFTIRYVIPKTVFYNLVFAKIFPQDQVLNLTKKESFLDIFKMKKSYHDCAGCEIIIRRFRKSFHLILVYFSPTAVTFVGYRCDYFGYFCNCRQIHVISQTVNHNFNNNLEFIHLIGYPQLVLLFWCNWP